MLIGNGSGGSPCDEAEIAPPARLSKLVFLHRKIFAVREMRARAMRQYVRHIPALISAIDWAALSIRSGLAMNLLRASVVASVVAATLFSSTAVKAQVPEAAHRGSREICGEKAELLGLWSKGHMVIIASWTSGASKTLQVQDFMQRQVVHPVFLTSNF